MSDNFTIDPDVCDGYPSFGIKLQPPDFSSIAETYFMKNYDIFESYPSFNRELINSNSIPKCMIFIDPDVCDGYPSFGIQIDDEIITKPYPKMMISSTPEFKNGYPSFRMSERMYGAFADTPLLTEVSIPRTVKRIADWAFYNSAIKEVTISKDCMYGEHTFPKDCKIKFY